MTEKLQPLSPHLTIYRWPITMILSITHRATGIFLSLGLFIFVLFLGSLAYSEETFYQFKNIFSGILGEVIVFGWSFSFFFHLANGIRHLIWDYGKMFEKKQATWSSWFVIIVAIVLTLCYWIFMEIDFL